MVKLLSMQVLPRAGAWSAAGLYRTFGAVAKDVIHQSGLVFTLLLASIGVLYLPWLLELTRPMQRVNAVHESAPHMYLVMLTTTAFLVGLVLSANEAENNTHSLLDALPARAALHFWYKVTAGAILVGGWLLAAGVLMGVLSGHGFGLIRRLFTEAPQLMSVMNVGRSGLITLLQIVGVFSTGLVMGLLFSTLTTSAVAGFFAYSCLLFVLGRGLENRNDIAQHVTSAAFIAWIVLGFFLYPAAVRYQRRRNRGAADEAQAVSAVVNRGMYLRLAGLAFDPPNRHLIRVPALLLVLLAPLLVLVPRMDAGILVLMVVPPLVGLLGAMAWKADERYSARFLVYVLPVNRNSVFWPRVGSLVVAGLVVGLALSTCLAVGIYLDQPANRREALLIEAFHPMMVVFALGTAVTALLGFLFRLFFRSMLIAAILASVIVVCWGAIVVVGMDQVALWGGKTVGIDTVTHGLWCTLVSLGLPILCAWVAFCRSRMLELPDNRRGRVAVALFFLLAVWGGFLLATPPSHIFRILFL